jgi:hypothetical protein
MFLDAYALIAMEQSAFPGSIGDSCSESSRYAVIAYVNGSKPNIKLGELVTDKGPIRHPSSPWREDDTSSDQVAPLIAATELVNPELAKKIIQNIKDSHYRTGNGDLISFGVLGQMRRAENKAMLWLSDLPLVFQSLIFKIPFRWSDSKKRFESSSGSSGDYLNFINALAFARAKNNVTWPMWLAMRFISKDTAKAKVADYYKPEPNSQWILDEYNTAIDKIWK